jgi:hypothetical protein
MQNQLEKAIKIAKKTGDKLIIFDNIRSDSAFVVMSLDAYEKVAINRSDVRGLTEDQLLDKINRDIAIWKSDQDEGFFSSHEKVENFENIQPKKSDIMEKRETTAENIYYRNDAEEASEEKKIEKNHWSIPKEVKQGAEEIIEEDRQYLEEVTF